MEKRVHFYIGIRNPLSWLMALCMICSAVARVLFVGLKGAELWSQIVLPIAACLLFALITLISGKEKTAIPIWLMGIYYAFVFFYQEFGHLDIMVGCLFAVALLLICVMYTQITAGKRRGMPFLVILLLIPPAAHTYLERSLLLSREFVQLLPDWLMTLGLLLVCFGLRIHPEGEYHPTWGDRADGRRIRTEPAMNQVAPYIMVDRNDATNSYTDAFEITNVERYIRKKRREGMISFGFLHVMMACYCRAVCKYPKINRFIAGQKIYSRGNDIQFCLTIKKEMTAEAPETVIKVHLSPTDTAEDVYNKINLEVEKAKNTPLDSGMDNTAAVLTMIPGVVLKFLVWVLKTMDYFGLLPKFLLEVSPFHGSVFFTSMGSLGIPPIYHHLYNFGNLPLFGSFGCKRRSIEVMEDGTLTQRKYVDCKFTMDERICDGFYYAAFLKHFKRILLKPETLDVPPEEVLSDID